MVFKEGDNLNRKNIENRISEGENRLAQAKKRLNMMSYCRLASAFFVLVWLVLGYQRLHLVGYVLAAGNAVLFCLMVHIFNVQKRDISLEENRLEVLARYMARNSMDWYNFPEDGAIYEKKDDYLSSDLDLFGPRSLFQYISVAHTVDGQDALMRLLTRPNLRYIAQRQDSVRELLRDDDLAIEFEALGLSRDKRQEKDKREAEVRLRSYATGKGNKSMASVRMLAIGMPAVTLFTVVAALMGIGSPMAVLYSFCLQIMSSILLSGVIQSERESVMALSKRMALMEARIESLLVPDFKSAYLSQMQKDLANASAGMKSLNRIASAWALRENFLFYWPLVGFLAWDFNCCVALNGWRKQYGASFGNWMDWLGEVEALYSLGTLERVRESETTMPTILATEAPTLYMKEGKHPLLDPAKVVGNDYAQGGETVIITGSNMSGKSTFMRTLAMNAVLAYAGGVVMAADFQVSPMRLFSSMRVKDDVSEGISSFYGEILRIKEMVQYAEKQEPMLVLVDEIFKGTNSTDRIIGARAAIEKLTKPWMMTVVTTHDFELCALAEEAHIGGKNYHFEEHYEGDAIAFDYKIRPGRCRTTNAQHLMRLAGLLDTDTVDTKEKNNVL